MKKVFKWILFILIATATMAAGMYCLAHYLDTDKPVSSDERVQNDSEKKKGFSFPGKRHYTKLNLHLSK